MNSHPFTSRVRGAAAAAVVACVLTSCEIVSISSSELHVTIAPRSLTLGVGDTVPVTHSIVHAASGSVSTRLSSSAPEVADVIPPDRVAGKAVGNAYLLLEAWTESGRFSRDSIPVQVR